MFLRHRLVWFIIAVVIVLLVSGFAGCQPVGGPSATEVLTSEQITAVGCDPEASEGQTKHCFATVIGCDPKNLPEDQKMNECMKDTIAYIIVAGVEAYKCPVGTELGSPPNEIAACVVETIQSGAWPGPNPE